MKEMLSMKMNLSKNIAIIGAGFGDEGKGMVTSTLCLQNPNPIVVRFSGGHQASHTVYHNGTMHRCSNFGAGVLQGVPTYWSPQCTVDPVGIINEFDILIPKLKKDIDETKLYIHKECPITTPYDKYANQNSSEGMADGTCGVGFGTTLQRELDGFSLTLEDLYDPVIMKIKLDLVRDYYSNHSHLEKILNRFRDIDDFREAVRRVTSNLHDIVVMVDEMPEEYETYIFEGSQGLLLDQDIGFFPHVTRSNVGTKYLSYNEPLDEVYYVTRAYQTRHGNGPMTNDLLPISINNECETNETNEYQGEFRTSILDLNLLKYALKRDTSRRLGEPHNNLVVTCMDQVGVYKYTIDGEVYEHNNSCDFITNMIRFLGFEDNVYLSRSSESSLINWIKK